MSSALHDFLVNTIGIEAANTVIVVDNATTTANANRTVLCSALERIERSKGGHDSAPLTPKRTRSKLRLPCSPHVSAFQHPESPSRNDSSKSKKGLACCLSPSPAAHSKSPSRWESNVAIEDRSPTPRQPRRMLSSNDLLKQSFTKAGPATRTSGSRTRKKSIVASISPLPLIEIEEEADEPEDLVSSKSRPSKTTAAPSPSPIGVRDFCCSRRQASDDDLLATLNASLDEWEIFEDDESLWSPSVKV